MSGKIFLIKGDQQLIALDETPYNTETLLQGLLAHYPDLLAPDQIGDAPRRWLFVAQAVPIAGAQARGGRLWLDHLFLDQDAIPTLVEVKQSADPRMRREVIGQLLDKAANMTTAFEAGAVRRLYENRLGRDAADQQLAERLQIEAVDEYWEAVDQNLQTGRIRLVFVADHIPEELERVVAFLNAQMSPAEVLALAIRQYTGAGLQTLVPTVSGNPVAQPRNTAATAARQSKPWDETAFLTEVAEASGAVAVQVARAIIRWVNDHAEHGLHFWRGAAAVPVLRVESSDHHSIGLWPSGKIEISFQHMKSQAPFADAALRREFMNWLNTIEGIYLDEESLDHRPDFPMQILADDAALQQFLGVLGWFVETVHEYHAR